ncbi:MAG TPA: DUF6580 family putative transport protein [Opitutaceae bacterium]|nr:DUF6580 family putative transport protein [Opitutaceae bacterium]
MRFALGLILLAVVWRIVAVFAPELSNFSPLMALTFCGAVYFRDKRLWLVPFLALSVSDFWIDWHYASVMHYGWSLGDALVRTGCFAAGLGIGLLVARRKNWLTLLGGALGASLLFYFVTNTQAWFGDAFYPKTLAGWWQALTVGHPEYPPTLLFFRNTLLSDLLFTGLFAGIMELAARRRGEESRLARQAAV